MTIHDVDAARQGFAKPPLAPSSAIEVDAAGATSIGQERSRNEDQFLIATLHRSLCVHSTSVGFEAGRWLPSGAVGTLLVVADGMGGHGGGAVASAVAVQAVAEYLCGVAPCFDRPARRAPIDSLPGVRAGLGSAVARGEEEVRRAAERTPSPKMGTTLTVAYLWFPLLYVAHVGDSRLYLSQGASLRRVTRDHTLAERLREQGHPELADGGEWDHVLWNAVGGGDTGDARPDMMRLRVEPDDALLLCSDGLTRHVSDARIAELLASGKSAAETATLLVKEANVAGGSDNITAVVARLARRALPECADGPLP